MVIPGNIPTGRYIIALYENPSLDYLKKKYGERGIRTLGALSSTHAFQACTFDHSDISPKIKSFPVPPDPME